VTEQPTVKIDLERPTVKVDALEMQSEARRSMGAFGAPVSVTLDADEPSRSRTKAGAVCVLLAFATGAVFARCERSEDYFAPPPPPMPPAERPNATPVTLHTVELHPPSPAPPKPAKQSSRRRSGSWLAKPLFSTKGTGP
jgi:hypothetical protein